MRMIIDPPQARILPDPAAAGVLFAWFSPAFPTGGFAYSQGLETVAAEGRVMDEAGLAAWIAAILAHGAGWSDAVLLRLAHAAVLSGDDAALRETVQLAAALAPSKERLAEALGQGEAFRAAVAAGWSDLVVDGLPARIAYPVAAGAASARLGTDVRTVVTAYLTAFCANLIAAGVRLGLCGQTGGVRVLSGLGPLITDLAARAERAGVDDLGGCALGADIAGMRHETLNGRLFLS